MALLELNRENLREVISRNPIVLVECRAEHCGACSSWTEEGAVDPLSRFAR
jgi:hypothetical protein